MRVLYFVDGIGGGAVTHVLSLAKGIASYGMESLVVFFMEGPSASLARDVGLDVRIVSRKSGIAPSLPWRLSRLIRKEKGDIVHTHTIGSNFYVRAATWLLRRRPLVVTTVHSFIIDELKGKAEVTWKDRLKYTRELCTQRFCRHFIAVSENLRNRVIEGGVSPTRTTVIHNGVDVLPESAIKEHRESVLREFNLRNEDILIGIVGRLVPLKNHAFFLELANELGKKISGLRFVIVGDGELLEPLRRMASGLETANHIIFTGWRNDSRRLMAALDIMVLCSEIEGMNLSLLEAMAYGKPVVGSNVNGIAEIILDEETGFLAPVGDREAFMARLERLITDKGLREAMGRRGREVVKREYSLERMVQKTVEVYERLKRETYE